MSDIVYDYELLHERFCNAHQRGGVLVLPVVHLGDTPDGFEQRRAAVEKWMMQRGIEFDVVLAEYVIIMATEQDVRQHEYMAGHLVQRGKEASNEDVQRIAIGVCKAVRGVMTFLNIPIQEGITLLSNPNGVIRMEKIRVQFGVDAVLDAIQRDFTRRDGRSNDLILVLLGVIIDEKDNPEKAVT